MVYISCDIDGRRSHVGKTRYLSISPQLKAQGRYSRTRRIPKPYPFTKFISWGKYKPIGNIPAVKPPVSGPWTTLSPSRISIDEDHVSSVRSTSDSKNSENGYGYTNLSQRIHPMRVQDWGGSIKSGNDVLSAFLSGQKIGAKLPVLNALRNRLVKARQRI